VGEMTKKMTADHNVFSYCSLQRTLYSKENALRSETGGMMEALRVLRVEESESTAKPVSS
jgi:hypothetical protein